MEPARQTAAGTRAIVVAGYPKSGSTWIARCAADLVGCPVAGFWGQPEHREMAVEGAERDSPYRCFKAHQPHAELGADAGGADAPALIYVVRDPRDVAVSGAHYFLFRRHIRRRPWLRLAAFWLRRQGRTREEISRRLLRPSRRLAFMVKTVLEGDASVEGWCRLPWAEHVRGYLRAGAPLVRYEDMLADPERECARILEHLGIARDAAAIRAVVDRHAFAREKERFVRQGETAKAAFLRQGCAGEWRSRLTAGQQALFRERLADLLRQLRYDV